jgi:cation diffusion facilitator CzcD-associated flavoprotein CzcO
MMSPSVLHEKTFDEEVPILIIGGGPSGLLLAFMLEKLGGPYAFSVLSYH